ncbi:hypothetical protein LTR39_006518, partial [Cryomyces antarcticus]
MPDRHSIFLQSFTTKNITFNNFAVQDQRNMPQTTSTTVVSTRSATNTAWFYPGMTPTTLSKTLTTTQTSASTAAATQTAAESPKDPYHIALYVAIGFGLVILFGVAAVLYFCCFRRRRAAKGAVRGQGTHLARRQHNGNDQYGAFGSRENNGFENIEMGASAPLPPRPVRK